MIYALVVLPVVAAVVAVWWLRSIDVLVRRQMRRQVVLELRSGETFRGVVLAVDGRSITLGSVESLIATQTEPVPVDGELLIPRGDVKFMQRP